MNTGVVTPNFTSNLSPETFATSNVEHAAYALCRDFEIVDATFIKNSVLFHFQGNKADLRNLISEFRSGFELPAVKFFASLTDVRQILRETRDGKREALERVRFFHGWERTQ
ncbi:MAG TPA: hypothetical protein VEK33_23185 [Terriglobales bacterium]|nr:hypothetical protein [Terriglobales bacterium]